MSGFELHRERLQVLLNAGCLTVEQVHSICLANGGHRTADANDDGCDRCGMHGMLIRSMQHRAADNLQSKLSDACGALKTENTALLVENATLRRRIEALERRKR